MAVTESVVFYNRILMCIVMAFSFCVGCACYALLAKKLGVSKEMDAASREKGSGLRYILYGLFTMQIFLSIGFANEFSNYFMSFIAMIVFFPLEIGLIIHVTPRKGARTFILALLVLAGLQLLIFLTDNDIISNEYPAEEYYRTYGLVVWMLVVQMALEMIKLGTLHFGHIRKFAQTLKYKRPELMLLSINIKLQIKDTFNVIIAIVNLPVQKSKTMKLSINHILKALHEKLVFKD